MSNVHALQFNHDPSVHAMQGTSPIYNLLPDMLSSLSKEASLPPEQFQSIMRHLLSFIAKEKQVDSLVEKLCLRFAATQVRQVICETALGEPL